MFTENVCCNVIGRSTSAQGDFHLCEQLSSGNFVIFITNLYTGHVRF